MKFKLIKGCVCDSLTVDGVEVVDMDDSQRKKIIKALFKWYMAHPDAIGDLVEHSIETYYDKYESDSIPCECCGDYVETITWEI